VGGQPREDPYPVQGVAGRLTGRVPAREALARASLLVPLCVVYGLLLVWPLGLLVRTSLDGGFAAYAEVVRNPLFRPAMVSTLVISAVTTGIAVVLGYVCAAAIWRAPPVLRPLAVAFVLLPFWTAVLVKNFAWAALLQDQGVFDTALRALGVPAHPVLLHNRFAVIVGMVHYVLPYAVLPIFATMSSLDARLEQVAASLGASRAAAVRLVIVPLTLPGVYAAALLVFIICTGFFITPVILGGPRDMMAANLVDFYARQLVDFRAASALAVMIIAGVSLLVSVYQWLPKEGQFGRL
jgi:putative spermidine/putrescine transport system permease protein